MSDPTTDPAVTVCFSVLIDGHDLGVFTSCDGLGFEVVVEQREEGGNNGYVHQLPSRVKYQNVKLKRPVNADSAAVTRWFGEVVTSLGAKDGAETTAEISAMTTEGTKIATWNLRGVIPIKWTGPSLSVDSAKVAEESLELAHHGFLS